MFTRYLTEKSVAHSEVRILGHATQVARPKTCCTTPPLATRSLNWTKGNTQLTFREGKRIQWLQVPMPRETTTTSMPQETMYTVSRLLFECVVGVWLGLVSVSLSSRWLSVSGWVELVLACACVCMCVCARWCNLSMHPFIIYVIFYYRFLCSIACLCVCKRKCFGILLHNLNEPYIS